MALYRIDDREPSLAPTAWVADSAEVIGSVVMEDGASVWFGAVLRGDSDTICLGRNTNVQDASVIHADPGFPTTLGNDVTIGHKVVLHGCTVGDGSLIGIGAIVLNGAKIGRNCLVGAGSLVTEGKEFPDGSMILGSPARVAKMMSPEQIDRMHHAARHYVENARRYAKGLVRIDEGIDTGHEKIK